MMGQAWRVYLTQLPTKEDFKALIMEVKDTHHSEIANMRQDLKAIADRVESLEEVHDTARRYTSQLQAHVSAQTKVFRETQRHLEDLYNEVAAG